MYFSEIIRTLDIFWEKQGCIIQPGYDMPMGAGTFHPATFLASLGSKPKFNAYTQACRRPTDGRYGKNPNRLQRYFQYQAVLKPSPDRIQDIYLDSINQLGIDPTQNDIRFVEDNWESPALAATGLGWEVWLNGMEVTQFTYFQQIGGLKCNPVMVELTYGLERLAMYIQGVNSVYDIIWGKSKDGLVSYGDIFQQNEFQQSAYNFEQADIKSLNEQFISAEKTHSQLCEQNLPLAAYEQLLIASHAFNLLDARRALSVLDRQEHILRIRKLATKTAKIYIELENNAK